MRRTPLRWHHTCSVNSVDPPFRAGREGAASVSTEENKALVNRFMDEVLNKKNLAVTDEIAVEDFVELDPLPGQGARASSRYSRCSSPPSPTNYGRWRSRRPKGRRSGAASRGGAPTEGSSWASLPPAERSR